MSLLPDGFAALAPFAERWAGETAARRADLRDRASFAELEAYYAAVQPLVQPALAVLDATPLAEHDETQTRLMNLLLTFAHVAMAVEVQREDERAHAGLRAHMTILRAPADAPRAVLR